MPRGMQWHNCIRCGAPVYGYKDRLCKPCWIKEPSLPPINAREAIRQLNEQRNQGRQ